MKGFRSRTVISVAIKSHTQQGSIKVQMIQTTQLVIIMKDNPILVKESGGWSGKENVKFHKSTAQQVSEARLDLRTVLWSTISGVNRVLIFQQYGSASSPNSTP